MKILWDKPLQFNLPQAVIDLYSLFATNPSLSDAEKINMMGNALKEMDSDVLLYLAAVGCVAVDKSIVYEVQINEVVIPSAIQTAARVVKKDEAKVRSKIATKAADARHSQVGGYRDKKQQVRDLLSTGRFKTKRACAKEAEKLYQVPYDTGLGYLENQNNPYKNKSQ